MSAAVFAYLSDFWMNYCIVGAYVEGLRGSNGLYMASLNHGVWIHRTLLADEWLQARNALSIKNFCEDTLFRRSPRLLRLKASSTASSGGIEPSLSFLRLSSLRGRAKDRHPVIDAEDVHGRRMADDVPRHHEEVALHPPAMPPSEPLAVAGRGAVSGASAARIRTP